MSDRTPASPAQQGVWLTERLGSAREVFHMPVRISFDRVDTRALAAAVDALIGRHPALSVRLVETAGGLHQERCAEPPALRVVGVPAECADLEKRLVEEAARPFAPEQGPPARFTLFERADGSAELLVVVHHAVFDGNSKDVLVRDLAVAYGGAPLPAPAAPAPAPAPAPAAVGAAAALTPDPQTVRLAAEHYGPRWAAATAPVLPGAARATVTAGPGESVERRLDAADRRALAASAERSGVTVFEFLLAALHGLLHRYGGEAVPVSVPLSTRTPEQAAEIGLFVNELPVHAPAVGAATGFADLARRVRTELRAGYPFRTVPFGAAVTGLTPRTALTPVSFGYRRRGPEPAFAGTRARVHWAVHHGTARNTLHLQAVDTGAALDLALQYDPAVLAPDAARRIAGHYGTLLAAAVAAPDAPLAELPLLDPAETHAVTVAPNATTRRYPADRTVLDLVRAQAAATPDAVAVSAGGRHLDYRALLDRTDHLAAALRARGVRPGDLVALHLDRTADLPAALLAVHAVGAAHLPLDPGYPAARLALVLADSGAAVLLADREPAPGVAAVAPALLRLAELADGPGAAGGTVPVRAAVSAPASAAEPVPADTAYVLYTSGSTGRPKGVVVGHRALVNLLTSFADRLGSGPGHAWLGLTSLSFDISALEIYLPLITGGRLVVAPDGLAVDGPGLLALIAEEGVTHVQATPSGWRVLLAAGPAPTTGPAPTIGPAPTAGGATAADPLSRVTGLVGGEALPLPLARELRARTARLFNVYGPTETTVWSTCAEIPEAPDRVTIGTPIANTRAYLVDERLRPTPLGIPGELLLGGDGVAHGYLGRPDLTADRFVPDPFGPPGSRLYRTGDRAVRTSDGSLDYLGRIDDQVKIRGHRIEPAEIESALLEHPDVAQAAVAVRTEPRAESGTGDATGHATGDPTGDGIGAPTDQACGEAPDDGEPFLAGYLVPVPGAEPPAVAALREHLLRTLPPAMVPQRWLVLERLPLTPNGKLDRRALPVPPREAPTGEPAAPTDSVGGRSGGADGPAWDEVTETVRRIWAEVLDVPDLGIGDDLFELGGHSLTVIRITARIRDALGVELDFDLFFDTPTAAAIAAAVRERR
ncbi:non-ribosomal peptide synthetase [Kitasatospora sp. NPDC054939]